MFFRAASGTHRCPALSTYVYSLLPCITHFRCSSTTIVPSSISEVPTSFPVKQVPQFATVSVPLSMTSRKRVSVVSLHDKYKAKVPITMVTAYDMASAMCDFC